MYSSSKNSEEREKKFISLLLLQEAHFKIYKIRIYATSGLKPAYFKYVYIYSFQEKKKYINKITFFINLYNVIINKTKKIEK